MYSNADNQASVYNDKNQQIEYLMLRFGKKVVKLAYYYLKDRHLAEDICQEVFIKVYKNLDKFKKQSKYYTWIYRITVNLCKDYMRSAVFKKLFPVGEVRELDISRVRANQYFEEVEGGDTFKKVMELPVKYRVVISLHYFEGFSTNEIAQLLKISESNVRVRLYRGREKLKALLAEADLI